MLVASQLEKLKEDLDKKVLVAGEAAAGEVGQEEGEQSERVERSTYSHQPSDRARAASLPSPSPSPPPEQII